MVNLVEHDEFFDDVEVRYQPSMEAANSRRKETEKYILDNIAKVSNEANVKLYKDLFSKMSDKDFDNFMVDLKTKKQTLCVVIPQGNEGYDTDKLLKIGKSLGIDFFQRLIYSGNEQRTGYKTKEKFLVVKLSVRRAQQLLTKKISTGEHSNRVNTLSGQVVDESKASKVSKPELNVLIGLGLTKTSNELMSIRGGDLGGVRAFTKFLAEDGVVRQEDVKQFKTGVVSTNTLISYLAGMHIKTNIEG